ncbi:hypothetical protein N665_0640s0020 [Sinapis alba]|nr:hypothetical protein N665_0640s0020 [Sinapis alba]
MATATFSDDLDYVTWAPTTKATLTEQGLWDVVENGVPPDPSKLPELSATIQPQELSQWRDLVVKDMKALQILQSSLTDSAFKKTLSASSAKDVWDILKTSSEQATQSRLDEKFIREEEKVEGVNKFSEDMWMIYSNGTTNHMTPYEKYFTVLDKTQKGKLGFPDGKCLRIEGRGDVKIMMKDGKKKTMKNVTFVPEFDRNVLCLDLMIARGYTIASRPDKCVLVDRTGAEFGDTVWGDEIRGPALYIPKPADF